MIELARKLRLRDYFALAFGTMIGVGWLVLMDDWLGRGGPYGAMLAFGIGGVLLLPVSYVYGEWVKRLPDAAGEAAYTAEVFPPIVSYFTGWIMLLAYFIVCPWEAVAVGKLAGYLVPSLDSIELYRIAGQPVFLPRLPKENNKRLAATKLPLKHWKRPNIAAIKMRCTGHCVPMACPNAAAVANRFPNKLCHGAAKETAAIAAT